MNRLGEFNEPVRCIIYHFEKKRWIQEEYSLYLQSYTSHHLLSKPDVKKSPSWMRGFLV